jgi:hypothetical protein
LAGPSVRVRGHDRHRDREGTHYPRMLVIVFFTVSCFVFMMFEIAV